MKRKLKRKNIKRMNREVNLPLGWREDAERIYGKKVDFRCWSKYGWAIRMEND